jgi:hypothetical protein
VLAAIGAMLAGAGKPERPTTEPAASATDRKDNRHIPAGIVPSERGRSQDRVAQIAPQAPAPRPAALDSGPVWTAVSPLLEQAAARRIPDTTAPRTQPLPPLPGGPYELFTREQIEALIAATPRVEALRHKVAADMRTAYRDPEEAQARFDALVKDLGDTKAAIAAVRQHGPELLGKLNGRTGFFAPADQANERFWAEQAAQRLPGRMSDLTSASEEIGKSYREIIERQRRIDAVPVPGLSVTAMQAVAWLERAGALPGWRAPARWLPFEPSADDIARAIRVAPVWQAIMEMPDIRAEFERFMAAAGERLPEQYDKPPHETYSAHGQVQAASSLLHAAKALHGMEPVLRAYAAAEPERRAAAQRQAEQKTAAQRREAEQRAEEARRIDKDLKAWRRHRARARPSPSPSPGP